MRSRILIGLIAGAIGGLLGWFIQEQLINYNALLVMQDNVCREVGNTPAAQQAAVISILSVCGCIGLFLGAVDGIVDQNPRKIFLGMLIGVMASLVIGGMGNNLGGLAYTALGGHHSIIQNPSPFSYTLQIIARAAQVGLWGLGIGTGVAISTLNPKRILYGAIGGLLGGTLTGVVFDLVSTGTAPIHSALGATGCIDVGGVGRAICFAGIGALTGLFIGIVEELLKQAWVKVLAGRNEGKDFILYKAVNLLGRDERCDVPLFGDNSVAVQHAAIRADGRRHFLLAADTPAGTLVNGQRVEPGAEQLLRDGDMIQIASHRILFHEKATAQRLTQPNADAMAVKKSGGAGVPIPSHLCSFCGAPKDANGNCRCSLGAPSAGAGGFGTPTVDPMAGYGAPPAGGYGAAGAMGGYAQLITGPLAGPPAFTAGADAIGQLVGETGPYAGQVFPLHGVNMEVGREPGKDISLAADTTISRGHARLVRENGGTVVMDLGSSNGTYVNGQRVTAPVALAPGDTVQFGSSKFRFE
ncbi:MAG TPA: FHA domain-containing protein [Chthonomonadaceae bacterium]|nr:FHA domain-containing protein [Chthonomonadaceae bacterium]